MKTCGAISLAQAGLGVEYRGTLGNSDYGLTLAIPRNLSGWGAADVAPFHGFTIFLPGRESSQGCIVFEIHLRVALGRKGRNGVSGDAAGRVVKVGNIAGRREDWAGLLEGVALKNVLVEFSVDRDSRTFDGQVWLVTSAEADARNEGILESFLSSLRFDGVGGR